MRTFLIFMLCIVIAFAAEIKLALEKEDYDGDSIYTVDHELVTPDMIECLRNLYSQPHDEKATDPKIRDRGCLIYCMHRRIGTFDENGIVPDKVLEREEEDIKKVIRDMIYTKMKDCKHKADNDKCMVAACFNNFPSENFWKRDYYFPLPDYYHLIN